MRTRLATAITAALLLATLTACGSGDDKPDGPATPTTTTAPADNSDDSKAAGIPAKPDAAKREVLLRALRAVNPAIAADEDKAIDNARNQCSTISGGGKADASAKARFSNSDHEVTDTEAKAINTALKATLCP
ncbi:hypothetical protein ACFCW6_01880 [Streptomyces sp. NPDC056333]|uniref:hypothetical protein n=1 Tax=Streptomyces sp. NPDC056333 TaxID=3345786 RepID=UPI0035DD655E